MHAKTEQGALAAICLVLAAAAIGFGIYLNSAFSFGAMRLITIGLIAAFVSVFWSKRPLSEARLQGWLTTGLLVIIGAQFAAIIPWWPVNIDPPGAHWVGFNTHLYFGLSGLAVILVATGALGLRGINQIWFPLLLVVHLLIGFTVIRSAGTPLIDVWYFEQGAARTLLAGHNPYDFHQTRYVDINPHAPGRQVVYGQNLVQPNGELLFGFPYPPFSLLCSTLAERLAGDSRYANAIAMTLAGLFIGYARPGFKSRLAAVLMLFTPITWYLLSAAWTEPIVVMSLSFTVFCACRRLRFVLPIAFGLFLASKQYVPLITPLAFLLLPGFDWRDRSSRRSLALLIGGGIAVAAAITLPFLLWNPRQFWTSIYTLQKVAPFRWNALSYLVWAHRESIAGRHLNPIKWLWVPFALLPPLMVFAAVKARQCPAGFCAAIGLIYLLFVAFNKQAFGNYYYFVVGCFCCAIAALPLTSPNPAEAERVIPSP